ncbi:hypothetical protein DZF96_00205 [Clavibacter michiganensis]|uniref:Uncharacterized protein n=1 Tax=Clavibacter michiganensis TaxID=28447 RepID=A0A399NZF4_9MICO|nr:hypothetical protein DZF96_00205 [Clavibacter michiganensis]
MSHELTGRRVELEAEMSAPLNERNALIGAASATKDGPTWAEISKSAGITVARVSQLDRRPSV